MVLGPRIGASSMNTFIICETISSWKMKTMHSWNSKGELVNPVGNEVMRSSPNGVRKAVMSQLASSIFLASNPQYRSSTVKHFPPRNWSTNWSSFGGMEDSFRLMALRGCKSCTMRSFCLASIQVQNHQDR